MHLAVALLSRCAEAQRGIEVLPAVTDGDSQQQVALLAQGKRLQRVEVVDRNLVQERGQGGFGQYGEGGGVVLREL